MPLFIRRIGTMSMARMQMPFVQNDGGRKVAGFNKSAGDCVCRAIAIAAALPYGEVWDRLSDGNGSQRRSKGRAARGFTADKGILIRRKWFRDYMASLGFVWHSCMSIGSGCKVHLALGELPMGRLVVQVSKHSTTVIDGVIHDTYDPSRAGTRCVYGYWKLEETI
jgi:hypothetical protein